MSPSAPQVLNTFSKLTLCLDCQLQPVLGLFFLLSPLPVNPFITPNASFLPTLCFFQGLRPQLSKHHRGSTKYHFQMLNMPEK